MSKLAHSNADTMIEIDIIKAIDNSDFDIIGLTGVAQPRSIRCQFLTPERCYKDKQPCSFMAKFTIPNGEQYCRIHTIKVMKEIMKNNEDETFHKSFTGT